MSKFKVFINGIDVTDQCTFEDDSNIRVTLAPADILKEEPPMEPVHVYGFYSSGHGRANIRYKIPRWMIGFMNAFFPGTFPDANTSKTT